MRETETRWIVFKAWGHRNVKATHKSTLELTRENYLTPRGDCIIGIRSEIGVVHLPDWFKERARSTRSLIILVICARGLCDSVVGRGHPGLSFSDEQRIIVRKSRYVDEKTIMINASKSAKDIRRDLINAIREEAEINVYLTVVEEFT